MKPVFVVQRNCLAEDVTFFVDGEQVGYFSYDHHGSSAMEHAVRLFAKTATAIGAQLVREEV